MMYSLSKRSYRLSSICNHSFIKIKCFSFQYKPHPQWSVPNRSLIKKSGILISLALYIIEQVGINPPLSFNNIESSTNPVYIFSNGLITRFTDVRSLCIIPLEMTKLQSSLFSNMSTCFCSFNGSVQRSLSAIKNNKKHRSQIFLPIIWDTLNPISSI